MKSSWSISIVAGAVVGSLLSCSGGGGGGDTSSSRTTGYDVPSEISPVPTDGASARIVNAPAFSQALQALSSQQGRVTAGLATDAGTDYTSAKTMRFVSEHSIDQFDIIETILNAMAQTHYAEAENINAGPYKAIVSWQENNQGAQSKSTMTWVVDSAIVRENGQDVNRLRAWIQEADRLIKAEFKIYASASKREDGSYQDYGVWAMNVKFNEAGTSFFAARASIGASGESIISINETGGGNGEEIRKATMHKAATIGYGKVTYPDWQGGNTPVQTVASYAYNATQLRVHSGSSTAYKDRASKVEINHRYGMYDSVTGEDVLKSHSFGFPVSYSSGGSQLYGYYGAWQGRHQLWAGQGSAIPDGTTVTRQDRGSAVESYQTRSFTGTLTKRTLVTATIADLLNIPVETWVNFSHQITWDGSQWLENSVPFTEFASLVSAPRKSVWINKGGMPPTNYVYLPAGPSGAGFYVATASGNGQFLSTGVKYNPTSSDQLWINVGGSIFIEYKGAGLGWVQKTVTAFDERNWTPTFDPSGDTPFALELNRQFYINKQGGNYVITRTDVSAYNVQIEIQTAANPANVASMLSGVTVFQPQGFHAGSSTYQFVTDSSDPRFLKLVYASVGTQDQNQVPVPSAGDVVTQGQWGMEAYNGGTSSGIQYNWDYPRNGENWGVQTFLYSDAGGYKLLDDAILLQPLTLTVNGGPKTLSLQYDGWMHGVPEFFGELARNNWVITDDVASKIINIPEGTTVTHAVDSSKSYLIKPLEVGQYLKLAASPDATLDIAAADAIDLTDPAVIPQFQDHLMGTMPELSVVKYSEGEKVQ